MGDGPSAALHRCAQGRLAGAFLGQGEAPHLGPLVLAELGEILDEAVEQVGLGDQHIDRQAHAQRGLQLVQPAARQVQRPVPGSGPPVRGAGG